MVLKIEYTTDSKGYSLVSDLDINIEPDAEAVGYAAAMFASCAALFETLMNKADPKYRERLMHGFNKGLSEARQNEIWPFDSFMVKN